VPREPAVTTKEVTTPRSASRVPDATFPASKVTQLWLNEEQAIALMMEIYNPCFAHVGVSTTSSTR